MTRSETEEQFRAALDSALYYHGPCKHSGVAANVDVLLIALYESGVRIPNDWDPQYTGAFGMRWYDYPEDPFRYIHKNVGVTIVPQEGGFIYSFKGNVTSGKQRHESSTMSFDCHDLDDAVRLIEVFVGMVDSTREAAEKAREE